MSSQNSSNHQNHHNNNNNNDDDSRPLSNPRPIHMVSREIRETPDQSEPSYSYEDSAFLADRGEDVEDAFHRKLTVQSNRREGSGGNSSVSSGSFWRTDAPSLPSKPVTVRERKSSGGLLGAALQLHSQSSTASDEKKQARERAIQENVAESAEKRTPTGLKIDLGDRKSPGNVSQGSLGGGPLGALRDPKKSITKQRNEARRLKLQGQLDEVDVGHVVEIPGEVSTGPMTPQTSLNRDRLASEDFTVAGNESVFSHDSHISDGGISRSTSGGGIINSSRKGSSATSILGKGSSLIFPTGLDTSKGNGDSADEKALRRQKVNLLLDQCESVRWPYKKKLLLNKLGLRARDIPVKDLYNTNLGSTLYKLSLSGNRLSSIPPKLVVCLPALKTLDLSQCRLHQLPERWQLPQLKRLNLSHNLLTDFPEESMLEGLLQLTELNLYGNKVSVIIVPNNPNHLAHLETLNLGYNDLAYLPEDLDRLKSLRVLKVMNNFLEKVPMRICDMDLKIIDVSSNPVIQPPIETCERGVQSMKRYYMNLRMEEQTTQPRKCTKTSSKNKNKFNLSKISFGRKSSDSQSQPSSSNSTSGASSTDALKSSNKDLKAVSSSLPPRIEKHSPSSPFALENQDELRAAKSLNETSAAHLQTKKVRMEESMNAQDSASVFTSAEETLELNDLAKNLDDVTVNDTLKVIFVGMEMAGKTSMIKRLIEGENAVIPKRDERTVGVDIYEWDPKDDKRFNHIDSRIELQDEELEGLCGDVNVKFSVWDFAGQHVYHATHELFFSSRALYVLVWDMGATNPATKSRKSTDTEKQQGAFSLNYDSDQDSDDDDDFTLEEESARADRALKRDIDDKIQFWVDCIQSSAPGAAILPVASFDDLFISNPQEAKRRCNILKQRLLEHDTRRLRGIRERLQMYIQENRANDETAHRLRKLLNSYSRPKLIFGKTEDDAVIRVSGTKYTGFADLTERIINIATGRERGNMTYPIFRGHVGARIPRMRLEVREAVRRMRDRFKVVEWGYFVRQLQEMGILDVEDISDALHFLTSIGELSYFGGLTDGQSKMVGNVDEEWAKDSRRASMSLMGSGEESVMSEDEDMDFSDDQGLFADSTTETLPTSGEGSLSTLGDTLSGGLSQFVFLNPRWLVAAVACILRHDLEREIQETYRAMAQGQKYIKRGDSFYDANLNCPVITAEDACLLWQAKKFTKKAAERVEQYSNNMPVKPFEFLQLLLIRFGVFVPIDLGIEKAFLGGTEYSQRMPQTDEKPSEILVDQSNSILKATFFFLPSLLGPGEPAEAWTFKSTDSWKATLCHSVLFPDGVPPGLMERITASVLSNIYAISHGHPQQSYKSLDNNQIVSQEGQLTVKEVLCWRTAFLLKVGMQRQGETTSSIVEVFCGLADKDSHLCVGSDSMLSGMRRLVTSGKGQEGDGGRKIWKGGYLIVVKAVQKVMAEYGGLEFEKHGFCPDCLAKKDIAKASFWDFAVIRAAVKNQENVMRCRYGHRIDTRLVAGPLENLQPTSSFGIGQLSHSPAVPIHDLLRGVVVVGLWDGHSKARKVVRVGSGFIADKKRGLIVTASHTLMNIWGDRNTPFGENYYGLRHAKVVIGVIPRTKGEDTGTEAVFRYVAKIVSKDPSIENGVCHLDACVLKITTRLENDVCGNGEGCGDEPEVLLFDPSKMKQEKLHQLKITDKCELDEQVRIVGYNQGGEGLLGPGITLNRYIDFARGYVCKKFAAGEGATDDQVQHRFKPREEIAIICPTIGGHSGGPCVNQQGEVIGILSRADPAESQRCYLVPTFEWRALLKEAKHVI